MDDNEEEDDDELFEADEKMENRKSLKFCFYPISANVL